MADQQRRWQRPRTRPLGRRTFLRGTAGLAGGLGLAGCADPVLGGLTSGTPMHFWNLFTGADGQRMLEMQQAFQKDFPDIGFNGVTLAWGAPYYTKLAMASAGGRAPDVAILHLARLQGFSPGHLLDPFDRDLLAEVGLDGKDFLPQLWQRSEVDGELYTIPLDSHPFVLYYNTDVCAEAGLLAEDGSLAPLAGEEAVLDAFRRAQEVTGELGVGMDAGSVSLWKVWWGLYRQLDGTMDLPEGGTVGMDDAKAARALEYMHQLVASGVTSPDLDAQGSVAAFSSGLAGFHINGGWEIATFLEADLPFRVAVFPDVFGNRRMTGDAHTFVLPHQRSRDPERTRASYEFIAHIVHHSLEWAKGGHIPAYQPVVEAPEYQDLMPQAEYRAAAESMELDPEAWFTGSGSQMQDQAGAAFLGVYRGETPVEQGLAQFRAAINKLLQTPSPA